MKAFNLFAGTALVATSAVSLGIPGPTPTTFVQNESRHKKRQQAPFSIQDLVPSAVDTRVYTKEGETSKFLGTDSAVLSVPTVTGTIDGQTVTTTVKANLGIFSGTPEGTNEEESSFVFAPELAQAIQKVMQGIKKRSLEARQDPPEAAESAVADILIAPMANAMDTPYLGIPTSPEVLADGTVTLQGRGLPAVGLLYYLATALVSAALISEMKNTIGTTRFGIKLKQGQLGTNREKKTCPSTKPSCSSCIGKLNFCTSGSDSGCPCNEDQKKCQKGKDTPGCQHDDCKGTKELKRCTTGQNEGCQCQWLVEAIYHPALSSGWIDEQQAVLKELFTDIGDLPSKSPQCGIDDGMKIRTPAPIYKLDSGNTRRPRDMLYDLRSMLCGNRCDLLPGYPSNSVKAVANGDTCEISVLVAETIEAWAIRKTSATGIQETDCWDSLANATESCAMKEEYREGWVSGPASGQFYQIGYRTPNRDGKLHDNFNTGTDHLEIFCPDPKPRCDTCNGARNGNVCLEGDARTCSCEPVSPGDVTQPDLPSVVNCHTAVAASEITCCKWDKSSWKTCMNMLEGCGVITDLEVICQSPVPADGYGATGVCGTITGDVHAPIVRGSRGDEIANCLNGAFNLNAQFQYNS